MEQGKIVGRYDIECVGPDGQVKWTDVAYNLIPNLGKNAILDNALGAGTGPTYYMSLITAGTASSASTYASPTVTEIVSGIVSGNTRQTITWTAAASGLKSANTVSFSITAGSPTTITGNMVVSGGTGANTVGNTSTSGGAAGILLSAANFSGGSKSVSSGDTLNCSYSVSI